MEKFRKFSGIYAIISGICIPALWIYFLAAGTINQLHSGSTVTALLITSEFITALLLLTGGIGLLMKQTWSREIWFLSIGMLLYALITSCGQFLQINHPLFAPLFIILTAATGCVALLSLLVKES